MSTSNATTGGVRNLRAMFENKASDLSTSPPSRGRSPNGSVTSNHSRPLSKVRTSFVAVERAGSTGGPPQLGLRRSSGDTMEAINGSAIMDGDSSPELNGPGLGAILKGSPFEDSEKQQRTGKAGKTPKSEHNRITKSNGIAEKAATMAKKIQDKTNGSSGPAPPAKLQTGALQTKPTSPTQTKKSPTVPTIPKPRGGGAKILGVMESANRAKEARAAAAAEAAAKKEETQKVNAAAAPKAPRASLPARLTRPPGAATAPTAASAAKNDANNANDAKAGEKKVVSRGPPRVASATTASSLAKKSSRASIGVTEQPKAKAPASRPAADQGFLARMMRPTASSAQKTHDKLQVDSPPRSKAVSTEKKPAANKPSRQSLNTAETDFEDKENKVVNEADTDSTLPEVAEEDPEIPKEQATPVALPTSE